MESVEITQNLGGTGPFYEPLRKANWLAFIFIFSGIFVSATWLALFVAGLLVDSAYYRAAISYNFADLKDWLMTLLSFTFSNVILLAFMSGLLGGVTSKLKATRTFRITQKEMAVIIERSKTQIENPFISAFRGMFVFVAILAMQYLSSFSDLGTISMNNEQVQVNSEINYEKFYTGISGQIKDTATLRIFRSEIKRHKLLVNTATSDSLIVSKILSLKARLKEIREDAEMSNKEVQEINNLEMKISALRKSLKVPASVDFSGIGISSFSYFKFAVIVSFLAFVFGYDSSKFAEFLGKLFKSAADDKVSKKNKIPH